jgi:hypothetical protein
LNTKVSGPSKIGTWTSRRPKQKEKFRLPNLRNGGKMFTIVSSYIKKEPKDGMTNESRSSNSSREIRYFSLTHIHLFGHGKLHSKWEGPYLVLHAADHGAVTLQCDDGDTFKANGQHLKLFL